MCGRILGDFGADVIKIEEPAGEVGRRVQPLLPNTAEPVSFMHATVNCNKRSLVLDLRSDEGRGLFLRLAESVDIVLENFRPGTMARLGLGYAAIAARKADTIYVSISGFGQFGPESHRVGYDPLAQSESGWLALNGAPGSEAVKAPTFLADDLGGVHAALGAMAALRHRDQTGEGQHVDIALLDAMWFQSSGYLTLGAVGIDLPRLGNEYRVAAPARVYDCRDGKVNAGVLLDQHWRRLAEVLGRPELAHDPRFATLEARLQHRREVDEIVTEWMAARTVDEAVKALSAVDLPIARVRTYAEAAADPNARERGMLQDVEQSEGTAIPITGPAAKMSRTPLRVRRGAPALGADSAEILAEIGVDETRFRALEAQGVTRGPATR